MREKPLCELWQLSETGPHTYSLCQLADFHEAMDMEEEYRRRWDENEKAKRKE
jgi:hypothetical protein